VKRNGGATIDAAARRVLDRNGESYALDSVVVAEHGLYYTRPIEGNDLFWYHERWVLPRPGWVVNRFAFHEKRANLPDWYIEPEIISVNDPLWRIQDGYLDVDIHDGDCYRVEDAGEFASGIAGGHIPLDEAVSVLRAFDRLCEALRINGCSGFELLREYAPSLPGSRITRAPDGLFALQ
jgi:predicted RNA-binding protein associated with RNAse of E/G family